MSSTLEKMRKNGVTAVNVIGTTENYWIATVIQGHYENEIIKCHTVLWQIITNHDLKWFDRLIWYQIRIGCVSKNCKNSSVKQCLVHRNHRMASSTQVLTQKMSTIIFDWRNVFYWVSILLVFRFTSNCPRNISGCYLVLPSFDSKLSQGPSERTAEAWIRMLTYLFAI